MTMTKRLACILAGSLLLTPSFGADKKELAQVQRDIALLQDEMRISLRAQNDRLVAIESMLKTMLDQINSTNRAVALLDSNLKSRVESSVVKPMAGFGSQMEGMQQDYRYVRATVDEVNSKLSRLSTQISDLENAVRTMQAPPAPPGAPAGMTPSASTPPQDVTAHSLYQNAKRDKDGGNYDLALREFSNYLAWFPTTDLAPDAQYRIGEIYYNQQKYEDAISAFDAVLERYPKNEKTDDARFMKGMSLEKLGKKSEAGEEFRTLISDSPGTELARRAQAELRSLNVGSSSRTRRKK
jgi:tol-pal system protein YbgF